MYRILQAVTLLLFLSFPAYAGVTESKTQYSGIDTSAPCSGMHNVVAGAILDLDAACSDSYSGSGQTWSNLASTGSTYDFNLGATSGAESSDPSFAGIAGSSSGRFTHDGGDFFRLAGTNTTFINAMTKTTGSEDFTLCWKGHVPSGHNTTSGLFGTRSGAAGNAGGDFWLRGNNQLAQSVQEQSSTSFSLSDNAVTLGAQNYVCIGHDHANNITTYWIDTNLGQDEAQTYGTGTTDAAFKMELGALGNARFPLQSGFESKSFVMLNKYATDAEILDIEAKWAERHGEPVPEGAEEIDLGFYENVTLNSAKEYTLTVSANPGVTGLAFNNDGTEMFTANNHVGEVDTFTLSTAYDPSTATHNASKSVSINASIPEPSSITFSSSGDAMIIADHDLADKIYTYDLSTNFDPSSGTLNASKEFDISAFTTSPRHVKFTSAGTKMWVADDQNDKIIAFDLSTAFDPSTASIDTGNELDVSAKETTPRGFDFKNGGTEIYIIGSDGDAIFPYKLDTAYDLTTASFATGKEKDFSSVEIFATDIIMNEARGEIYFVGTANDKIYVYD